MPINISKGRRRTAGCCSAVLVAFESIASTLGVLGMRIEAPRSYSSVQIIVLDSARDGTRRLAMAGVEFADMLLNAETPERIAL